MSGQIIFIFCMLVLAALALRLASNEKKTKKLTPKEEEQFELMRYDPQKGTYVKKNKE